jgi:PadR family transcriptional regulator, regulatory protein PadR
MAATDRMELLQGTLELLILRVLRWGPHHGHGIATAIRQASGDQLTVEGGSLYPALQRLLRDGCVTASWSTSTNNRRARYYTLTAAGRKHLAAERKEFERVVAAIHAVLALA